MITQLEPDHYRALIEARIFEPEALTSALKQRRRRSIAGADGRMLILAADHTARGKLLAGNDPLAIADRYTLLDRLLRGLANPRTDGVLASADILEELAWLGALDGKLAIGTMNRGGVLGAQWELDDRMTAYDADHIAEYGLDGGKVLLRIEDTDPGVVRTMESIGKVVTELADRNIMCMIEPLPYLKDAAGLATLDPSVERMVKVVAIASGLGSSSARVWMKLPNSDRMAEIAGATSMPILMLGGNPGADTEKTFQGWETSMNVPNVRGLVAGRPLLYPHAGSVEDTIEKAANTVHGRNK